MRDIIVFLILYISATSTGVCTAREKYTTEFYFFSGHTIIECAINGVKYYSLNKNMMPYIIGTNNFESKIVLEEINRCFNKSLDNNLSDLSPRAHKLVIDILNNPITTPFFYDISLCGFGEAYNIRKSTGKKKLTRDQMMQIVKKCNSYYLKKYSDKLTN